MKNLFIPPLNTALTLAQDWTFNLYADSANYSLFSALKTQPPRDSRGFCDDRLFKEMTLPAGTALTLRTYRIRLGQHDYAHVSVTATLNGKGRRFWVKLADANKIVYAEDETEHLTASPANAAHLNRSIAQLQAGQAKERELVR